MTFCLHMNTIFFVVVIKWKEKNNFIIKLIGSKDKKKKNCVLNKILFFYSNLIKKNSVQNTLQSNFLLLFKSHQNRYEYFFIMYSTRSDLAILYLNHPLIKKKF